MDQLDGELRRLQELGASLEQKLSQEAVDLEQLARQKKAPGVSAGDVERGAERGRSKLTRRGW